MWRLLLAFLGALFNSAQAARRVHFYTFSDTIPHPGLCVLAEATFELGGVLRIMGLSKRPGYILIHSHSPTLKFLMLQEVLEYEVSKGRIAGDDLVIFADGHDVLLQQPLDDILTAYSRWPGSPYLISGERNCWPWPHTHASHGAWDLADWSSHANMSWTINRWMKLTPFDFCRMIRADGPYPFPNIGLSMGPVSKVIEVLRRNNRIVLEEDVNDQGAMWLVIMRHALELNIQIDQHAEVFMNMLEYKAGELEREPCSQGWFQGPGARPPRNVLTNTTPGLLHFNGPSHEDDVWPACYHTINNQFRKVNAGHRFFDVDHNMMVSTDHICDYSYYNIHSFHAHPLSSHALHFLEDFYRRPVDPGLLAWRGEDSAVDAVRFGQEAELHASSPILHKVLKAGR